MSIYYITTKSGDIYQLDSTEEMQYSDSGKLTSNLIESGVEVADHYVNKLKRIVLRGRISDIKSLRVSQDRSKNTGDWITGLESLKGEVEPVDITWREENSEVNGVDKILEGCLIEQLTLSQDSVVGHFDGVYSYKVRLDLVQPRYASRATIQVERNNLIVEATAEKSTGKGGTQSLTDSEQETYKLTTSEAYALASINGIEASVKEAR